MTQPGGATGQARSLVALVATSLVAHDVPDATATELAAAGRYVDESLAAMPDVTRAGVTVASGVAYLALSVLGRAPYRRQSPATRSAGAVRLVRLPLPVIAEFGRLTRGLGLVGVFEHRDQTGGLR